MSIINALVTMTKRQPTLNENGYPPTPGIAKAAAMVRTDRNATVPCKWCGNPTRMRGTRMCDGCWELDWRIRATPALAQRILDDVHEEH